MALRLLLVHQIRKRKAPSWRKGAKLFGVSKTSDPDEEAQLDILHITQMGETGAFLLEAPRTRVRLGWRGGIVPVLPRYN